MKIRLFVFPHLAAAVSPSPSDPSPRLTIISHVHLHTSHMHIHLHTLTPRAWNKYLFHGHAHLHTDSICLFISSLEEWICLLPSITLSPIPSLARADNRSAAEKSRDLGCRRFTPTDRLSLRRLGEVRSGRQQPEGTIISRSPGFIPRSTAWGLKRKNASSLRQLVFSRVRAAHLHR